MSRHRAPHPAEHGFRLLFVCTGNICRSPFAELLTRHLLIGRLGGREAALFDVQSAGVQAVVEGEMHPDSRAELAPWGLDRAAADRFVARQLRSVMIEEADLVLGATPRHRSSVVERNPVGLPKTFGLREFARLAQAVDGCDLPEPPVERARALVGLARGRRGLVPPVPPEDDQVPDPMGRSAEEHHRAAELIREAVSVIVDIVAPARPAVVPLRRPALPPPPRPGVQQALPPFGPPSRLR